MARLVRVIAESSCCSKPINAGSDEVLPGRALKEPGIRQLAAVEAWTILFDQILKRAVRSAS